MVQQRIISGDAVKRYVGPACVLTLLLCSIGMVRGDFGPGIDHERLDAEQAKVAQMRKTDGDEAFTTRICAKLNRLVDIHDVHHPRRDALALQEGTPEHDWALHEYFILAALPELAKAGDERAVAVLRQFLPMCTDDRGSRPLYFGYIFDTRLNDAYLTLAIQHGEPFEALTHYLRESGQDNEFEKHWERWLTARNYDEQQLLNFLRQEYVGLAALRAPANVVRMMRLLAKTDALTVAQWLELLHDPHALIQAAALPGVAHRRDLADEFGGVTERHLAALTQAIERDPAVKRIAIGEHDIERGLLTSWLLTAIEDRPLPTFRAKLELLEVLEGLDPRDSRATSILEKHYRRPE